MFRKVLVASDLSEPAMRAVNEALQLAAAQGAEAAVCHVIPNVIEMQPLFPQDANADVTTILAFEAKIRDELAARVEELVGDRDQDVAMFVERGEPYAQIVRRAEAWGADLLVIGSHGRTGVSRVLLGSVAERVVRYAHSPVLVVREHAPSGVVLAATDLSDPSLPAVAAGAAEARRRGARLVLVHVMDLRADVYAAAAGGLLGAVGALPPITLLQERRDALLSTLGSALERENVAGEPVVLEGEPAAAIVMEAERRNAELVVVGTHGRTGLSRMALGSVAERVVRTAHCPVLAVRLSNG